MNIKFEPPSPPRPLTLSGREYGKEPPRLLAFRRVAVRCRIWLEDGTAGPLLTHSLEVYVYKQLVDDAQCQKCFRCEPTPANMLWATRPTPAS